LLTACPWQVWLLEAWLAGVALMFLRLVGVIVGGGRLLKSCQPTSDPGVLDLVQRLREHIGIGRRIRVLVGERIATPGVIGCFWPSLLLPVSMLSGIPAEDLQAILVHELAHIKRYDYLVNFLQMVVEALLFFNPAVWWIGRQIRIEREACCDAAVVRWAQPSGSARAPTAGVCSTACGESCSPATSPGRACPGTSRRRWSL
jgi:beta-lactamase regulating signal transducer with metallopeptidase domain